MPDCVIHQLPMFTDNYVFFLEDTTTREVAVIDPGDPDLVLNACKEHGWILTHILNTHHHWDHTDGNLAVKEATECEIVGFGPDAARIPGIDTHLNDGDSYNWHGNTAQILHVPGHTTGIITYYFKDMGVAFVGDALFVMSCGRMFEGTYEEFHQSLQRLAALPDDTIIYCAHEYTLTNAAFAREAEPQNPDIMQRAEDVKALRKEGKPTVPTTIADEKATNPMIRAHNAEEFKRARQLRDTF